MKKILLITTLLALIGCSNQSENKVNNENMSQPDVAQPEDTEKSDSEKYAELISKNFDLKKTELYKLIKISFFSNLIPIII